MFIKLWGHQEKTIEKAKSHDSFALFWEPGTGKTRAMIEILKARYNNNGIMKTLILCPLVVMKNWQDEFKKYSLIDESNIFVLQGSQENRIKDFTTLKAPIFITNYESLGMEKLFKRLCMWTPDILVLDESHKCKSHNSKRTKKAIILSDLVKYKYLLTGTPVTNSAMDLYPQFRILDGGDLLGRNFMQFKLEYFYDENYSFKHKSHYFPNWKLRPDKIEVLRNKVASISTSVKKKECLDLPPLQKIVRPVPLSKTQKIVYESLLKDFVAFIERGDSVDIVSAQLAITKALRLMQVTSGFYKEETGNEIVFKDNPKLLMLAELIEEITNSDNKVLVWAVFHKNYEMIKEVCESLNVKYAECHGDIPDSRKQAEIDRFRKDPNTKVYIGHPLSGGIGINLVEAAYSIYYSRNFSLEAEIQSEARNYRGGSEIHESITRIDLVCEDTIEEKIRQALASKEQIGEAMIKNIVLEK